MRARPIISYIIGLGWMDLDGPGWDGYGYGMRMGIDVGKGERTDRH